MKRIIFYFLFSLIFSAPTYSATQLELSTQVKGILPNANTTAASTNTANAIVKRDASGNFSAGTITATVTGNASTASALAANGTNCSTGNYPLGVDASGNAESCTALASGSWGGTVVTCTGVAATDTANLQAAFLAGGDVFIAPGTCKLTGTGTEILLITSKGNYYGAGPSTILEVQTGTGATTDIIRVSPTANITNLRIHDFAVTTQVYATQTGRHTINFDLSGNTKWLDGMQVYGITDGDYSGNTRVGYSIYAPAYTLSAPQISANAWIFDSTFRDNVFANGVNMSNVGDSVRFVRDHLWGSYNGGIEIVNVAGANHLLVANCNMWMRNKAGVKVFGDMPQIRDNNIEVYSATDTATNKAVVWVWGGTVGSGGTRSLLPEITGNTIIALSGVTMQAVRLENTDQAIVSSNFLAGQGAAGSEDLFINSTNVAANVRSDNVYNYSLTSINAATLDYVDNMVGYDNTNANNVTTGANGIFRHPGGTQGLYARIRSTYTGIAGTTYPTQLLQYGGGAFEIYTDYAPLVFGTGALERMQLTTAGALKYNGNVTFSNTAPTIASGFGTSPSVTASNGTTAFSVNVGTGGIASSGVLTMPAATTGWNCRAHATAVSADTGVLVAPTSTTSVTITNYAVSTGLAKAWPASAVVMVSCIGY